MPDSLCSQIAAGEVIQRPASVVKELLENSVDAGSTEIKLILEDYGKTLIRVVDNGVGMSEIDARMCLEKHATSKIKTSEDLFNIKTMGFRGEAIASIVSVSQSNITTKPHDTDLGTSIIVEGAVVKSQVPCVCKDGTSFSVKNLFFNIPVRRAFLKSPQIEMRHIVNEFKHIALSRPDISFTMENNRHCVYELISTNLANRITDIYGNIYKKHLIQCTEEQNDFAKINGFIGDPTCAKKSKGEQFLFINGRLVKNTNIHHYVNSAYEHLISKDKNPFYVLFVNMDPSSVDVNIHPAKTEVKIKDEEIVGALLRNTIIKSLVTHEAPQIDFDKNSTIRLPQQSNTTLTKTSCVQDVVANRPILDCSGTIDDTQQLWTKPISVSNDTIHASAKNDSGNDIEVGSYDARIIQLKSSFIVTTVKSGILVIDQHRAHARILYEKYLDLYNNDHHASQRLLFPQTIELSKDDYELLKEHNDLLSNFKFIIHFENDHNVSVTGVPCVIDCDLNSVLETIVSCIKSSSSVCNRVYDDIAKSLAQRTSITGHKILTVSEMETIINRLFSCKDSKYTPSGQVIWNIIKCDCVEDL